MPKAGSWIFAHSMLALRFILGIEKRWNRKMINTRKVKIIVMKRPMLKMSKENTASKKRSGSKTGK